MAAATDLLQEVGIATATTLSSPGYTDGVSTSITVGSTSNMPTATGITFAIDVAEVVNGEEVQVAGTYCEFVGTVATATTITNVSRVNGTGQNYAAGALTRVYIPVSAERENRIVEWGLTHADQDGTLKAGAVDVTAVIADGVITKAKLATAEKSALDSGWSPKYGDTTMPAPNTVTCNGNRSYDVIFNSVDLTGYLSAGMRIRTTRTVAAPTQCADLESSSSQYFSKSSPTGISFTVTWTAMGWVKLESYVAGGIIARRNADTEGWSLSVNSTGQVLAGSYRIAANNSVTTSYQSLPLNKWVHVAAAVDLAGTTLLYLDGVLVPSATVVTGTAATLVQGTTALVVGAEKSAGTNPLDGKIAQAAVFSSKLSAATIASYVSQTLSGAESTNVSAFSLNGVLTDLNANANTLTASGGAAATATDSPFGGQADGTISSTLDYAIITKTAFSTNTTLTVQVPEGCTIPTSGGVTALAYSTQKAPYLFPAQADKWQVLTLWLANVSASGSTTNTIYNPAGINLNIPIGAWQLRGNLTCSVNPTSTSSTMWAALSSSSSAYSDYELAQQSFLNTLGAGSTFIWTATPRKNISLSAATPYYALVLSSVALNSNLSINGAASATTPLPSYIVAECALL